MTKDVLNTLNTPIPFLDRCTNLKESYSLIWPFLNVAKGSGPYELFLDNNALTRTRWLSDLPDSVKGKVVVNPWLALMEQWVSNAEFRCDPENRIKTFIAPFENAGIKFSSNHAANLADILSKNTRQIHTQWSLPFLHLAIVRKMLDRKFTLDLWAQELGKVANADIPRFSGCLILGTLVGYLANQKGLKLASKQALWPYIDSFFAYQPSKKKEPEYVTAAYLRNRAGDLSSWYMWPMLLQHCYKQAGEPVVVTQDKALREVLFRLLPPCVTPSRAVAFSPSLDELTVDDKRALISLMTTICDVPIRGAADPSQQRERMKRLLILAKSYCTRAEEKQELDEVWDQWYLPGAGLEMHL